MRATDWGEFKTFMSSFIRRLTTDPWLQTAYKIVATERNTGYVAGQMKEITDPVPRCYSLSTDPKKDPGVFTSPHNKNEFAVCLRHILESGGLFFLRNFVVAPAIRGGPLEEDHREELVHEYLDQLRRAQPSGAPESRDGKRRHVGWSAKCDEDGITNPNLNDDTLITTALGAWVMAKWEARGFPLVPWAAIDAQIRGTTHA